jgi:beta-1,4-mannosyl-glycoprotein beta-1,4-N-acetylglucosaminyltransferase
MRAVALRKFEIDNTHMIIDTFTFFNELDLLEIRLEELRGVVDLFVLVEATQTFSGKPKDLAFAQAADRFSNFPIEHVVMTSFPDAPVDVRCLGEAWEREAFTRRAIGERLKELCISSDAIVMLSDVDEIPRADCVVTYARLLTEELPGTTYVLAQELSYYYVNCLADQEPWLGTRLALHDPTRDMQAFRTSAGVVIPSGGWHFSYLGGVDSIQSKIQAYAHTENDTPGNLDPAHIQSCLLNGADLFGRNIEYRFVMIDSTFPRHLLSNQSRFAHLIYDGPRDGKRRYSQIIPDYTEYLSLQSTRFESFEETIPRVVTAMRRTFAWLIRGLSADARVLDAACGDGASLSILQELGLNPIGVEYNENKLRMAIAKGCAVRADLHDLSAFQDREFDCVVSSHTLEHMYDPKRVVSELRRVLKPGGRLLVVLPYPDVGNEEAHGGKYALGSDVVDGGGTVLDFFRRMGFEILDYKLDDQREPEIWIVANLPEETETGPATIDRLYANATATISDINSHLDYLYRLASTVNHVTEFGTRAGVSTLAFLKARPARLVSYDLKRDAAIEQLDEVTRREGIGFEFHEADVLATEIEETDLLFIDTWHDGPQVRAELAKHADKARRYIVFHDTATYGNHGETTGCEGIWPGIAEFVRDHGDWHLARHFGHNNGLTVLARF